jgi:hypothetical protein
MNDTQHAASFMESVGWQGILFAIGVVIVACLVLGYVHKERITSWRNSRSDSDTVDTPGANPTVPTPEPSRAHADKHDAGHGGGHGHGWSFADSVIVGPIALVVLILLGVWWWHSGSSSDVAQSTTSRQVVGTITTYKPPQVDPSCIMTRQPQLCHLKMDGQVLPVAPDIPAGMTLCLTPSISEANVPEDKRKYKSVMVILTSGESHVYDQNHPEMGTIMGLELVPNKPNTTVHQFVADGPDAAGC